MARDINTHSSDWCNLVFEGRNKKYGAYRLRITSAKRHFVAFALVVLSSLFLVSLPTLIDTIGYYVFNYKVSDFSVEDYNYINDHVTKLELMQLSTPLPPTPREKKIVRNKPSISDAKPIETKPLEIVTEAPINETTPSANDTLSTPINTQEAATAEEEPLDDGNLYAVVEEMPSFPGGEAGLAEYIHKNLRYPFKAANKRIENCVICTFIIDTEGHVSQVEVVQPVHPLLDKEAVRVLQSLPAWKPARQHGLPIRVKYTLPIVFRLK